jgi:Mg-chelatase subunit ChlI
MRSANGGPAFPVPGLQHDEDFNGMTLRDYFAAKVEIDPELSVKAAEALVGRKMPDYAVDPVASMQFWAEVGARLRYMQADAMLAERAK